MECLIQRYLAPAIGNFNSSCNIVTFHTNQCTFIDDFVKITLLLWLGKQIRLLVKYSFFICFLSLVFYTKITYGVSSFTSYHFFSIFFESFWINVINVTLVCIISLLYFTFCNYITVNAV